MTEYGTPATSDSAPPAHARATGRGRVATRARRWLDGPLLLVAVLLVAFWLRAPFVSANLPFIYDEDEAHHFQRLVEMVKTGSYNPRYFNKPSLHFYLRMPVVAASFISAVKHGELRSVRELVTRVPETGGWAATASHARILAWNRGFGVALGLLAVVLAYAVARELLGSHALAIGAAWLTACSPPLARDAAKIGVDTPLVTISLAAILLALRLHRRFSAGGLLAAGLVAGLAVSTKYNAAPIAALPLLVCLLERQWSAGPILLAIAGPILGFVAGTPFALASLPHFLDNLAFEAWHYGTAGHGFATGTPGWPQAVVYTRWFASQALGIVAVVLAVAGLVALAAGRRAAAVTALWFPATFFALMVAQKVNFTRNVFPVVPMLAVLAAAGIGLLAGTRWSRAPRLMVAVLILVASAQPLLQAIRQRTTIARAAPDSRMAASRWITEVTGVDAEAVVSVQLQLPFEARRHRGVTEMDQAAMVPAELYQQGFDRLVAGPGFPPAQAFLQKEMAFPGLRDIRRVPRSPETTVFRLVTGPSAEVDALLKTPAHTLSPVIAYPGGRAVSVGGGRCPPAEPSAVIAPAEPCWVPARLTRLPLDVRAAGAASAGTLMVTLDVLSPWDAQSCTFAAGEWRSADLCSGLPPERWQAVSFSLPAAAARNGLVLMVEEVHPARTDGDSKARPSRVGLALRDIRVSR